MTSSGQVAPGAEQVGQARIITELGKPFELGALFQGADEGAFGDVVGGEPCGVCSVYVGHVVRWTLLIW